MMEMCVKIMNFHVNKTCGHTVLIYQPAKFRHAIKSPVASELFFSWKIKTWEKDLSKHPGNKL